MRRAPSPRLHLFVCANRRLEPGSPLGPGCAERGDALYDALKAEVANRSAFTTTWVTKTHCLGICPRHGATVARYPIGEILADVEVADVATLMTMPPAPPPDLDAADADLAKAEELQREKVLDLARRLKPGLTAEDVQNPHDFPELADSDWQYADGVLNGLTTARSALRALKKRSD